MPVCELTELCLFFKGKIMGKTGNIDGYKTQYCLDDNSNCARYAVSMALGETNVPRDLLPHHGDPPVTFSGYKGKARFIFDRRQGMERRVDEKTFAIEIYGRERREGLERRSERERRDNWLRVSRWASVYTGTE